MIISIDCFLYGVVVMLIMLLILFSVSIRNEWMIRFVRRSISGWIWYWDWWWIWYWLIGSVWIGVGLEIDRIGTACLNRAADLLAVRNKAADLIAVRGVCSGCDERMLLADHLEFANWQKDQKFLKTFATCSQSRWNVIIYLFLTNTVPKRHQIKIVNFCLRYKFRLSRKKRKFQI